MVMPVVTVPVNPLATVSVVAAQLPVNVAVGVLDVMV
jgi:hypothetical protein